MEEDTGTTSLFSVRNEKPGGSTLSDPWKTATEASKVRDQTLFKCTYFLEFPQP
jgi:hypothetical protein